MKDRKLLFFDIDGTLLSEKTHTVPQSAKEALKKANILKDMYLQKEGDQYKYSISGLCTALNISKGTLYNYLSGIGVEKRGNSF